MNSPRRVVTWATTRSWQPNNSMPWRGTTREASADPNLPAPDVPDGQDENDNVETRRWWVGMDEGATFPTYAEYQRSLTGTSVSSWHLGLGVGAKLAGSMFPLYRGAGARLVRALGFYALNSHIADYEEIDRRVSPSPRP